MHGKHLKGVTLLKRPDRLCTNAIIAINEKNHGFSNPFIDYGHFEQQY